MAGSNVETLHSNAAPGQRVSLEGKWTGGIKDLLLDCPVDAAWELASDWANWQRWWPGNPKFELRKGENRRVGYLRYVADVRNLPGAWCHECLVAIDNENHFFSYMVEENEVYWGLEGYTAKAQFRATGDGKTLLILCPSSADLHLRMSRRPLWSKLNVID